MANYNAGRSQVPFGDGKSISTSDISDSDDLTESTMEKAMKDIFMSCDENNTNMVLVSKLIDFITPFMQQNISELLELKKALDPGNVDPYINKETFFKVMSEWTSRLLQEPTTESSLNRSFSCGSEGSTEKDVTYNVFTSSVGHHFLKGYTESGIQNVSTASSCSLIVNPSDVSMLQDHIRELEHQNRKVTEELKHVRLQLTNCEEQNEVLQADVDKISRKLILEQQLHTQLQTNIKDNEELIETSTIAQKQIAKFEKLLALAEKDNQLLKQNIKTMESEKQKLEENIEQMLKREKDSTKIITEFHAEINYKDQENASLEEMNSQLKNKLTEQQQIITHYTDVNERLKAEKVKLEQRFFERLSRSFLSNQSKSHSGSFSGYNNKSGIFQQPTNIPSQKQFVRSNSVNLPAQTIPSSSLHSPRSKLMHKLSDFNSPKFLAKIAHPVSPFLSSSKQCKKSVDSDNDSVFINNKHEPNSPTNQTSTPKQQILPRPLLDETPPSVIRRLPVLHPVHTSPNKEPSTTKDLSFFSQYRLVGNCTENDMQFQSDYRARDAIKSICECQLKYDSNLNIIMDSAVQNNTSPSFSNGNSSANNDLSTMYVVERTPDIPITERSPTSSSPRSGILDSSEDEVLWKVQMMNLSSPHESLEQEINQADNGCPRTDCRQIVNKLKTTICHLQAKIIENDNTIKQLVKDLNHQNMKNEKHLNECEENYKQLQNNYKDLESDNSSKYIRILDLMEQNEKLQKQLKSTDVRFMELNSLKGKVMELQQERESLQEQVNHCEKQRCETILEQMQSIKSESELLRSRLDMSTETEQKLSKEFEMICRENTDLRTRTEYLDETIHDLNIAKSKLTNSIQKLTDENNFLKGEVKSKLEMELEMSGKLTNVLNENIMLKENLLKTEPEKTETQSEQLETCKIVIREHTETIEKLLQTLDEKKRQVSLLKKMVNSQNTNIKALETNKLNNTDQIYEQKCVNEKLIEDNKMLLDKLDNSEKEKKRLQSRLLTIDDCNQNIQSELENVRCDNKKMKDAHNLITEHQLLLEDKELLIKQKEELCADNCKLNETNKDLEQELCQLQQNKDDLSISMEDIKLKLQFAEISINELTGKVQRLKQNEKHLTKGFKEQVAQLENASQTLHIENKNILENYERIKTNYEIIKNEREILMTEKNNWQEMKNNFTDSLASAQLETSRLQERIHEFETKSESVLNKEEVPCENCANLITELDDLNSYVDELNLKIDNLEVEERNSKKGNFEKMQLKIEKLKSKMDEVEDLLKTEKQKVEALEQSNLKLLKQIDDNQKRHTILSSEKLELEQQMNKLAQELQQVQQGKLQLVQEKESILKNNASVEKKLRQVTKENTQLQQEITDVVNRKSILEKKSIKLQRDLRNKTALEAKAELAAKAREDLLETSNKTNDHLHHEINHLCRHKSDLEKQVEKLQEKLKDRNNKIEALETEAKTKEDLLQSINKECVQLQREIENLTQEKNNLIKKLEKVQHDLQKSETKNLSIRKLLTDMRSSVYEDGDDTLQENVEALLKEKDSQVDILQKQLKNYENELTEVKIKLCESSSSLNSLSEHVDIINKELSEKRQRLRRSILTLVDNWRIVLENRSEMSSVLQALDSDEVINVTGDLNSADVVSDHTAGLLDEEICKFKYQVHSIAQFIEALSTLELPLPSTTEKSSSENAAPPILNQRFVKKVTLKTTTTEIRSIDPDNPLLDKTVKLESQSSVKSEDDSTNTLNKSEDNSQTEESASKVGNEGFVYNSSLEVASPSLSDTVLESLNLLNNDRSPNLTEREMEHRFGILVAAFMIDVSSIKGRYQKQQVLLNDMEGKFFIETHKLVTTLKTMQELDKEESLESHIKMCLQQVELIIRMFTQASVSAMQYGALYHEYRLVKCINLMINHAAYLKRIVENATHQLKSIRSTSLTPTHRSSPNLSNSNSSTDTSITSQEPDDVSNKNAAVEVNIMEQLTLLPFHKRILFGVKRTVARVTKRFKSFFVIPILFLLSLCIVFVSFTQMNCNESSSSMYPWQWVSWDDVFSPYVKKSFPNGAPPV